MLRHRIAGCALGLAAFVVAVGPAASAPDSDLSGDWKLTGQNGVGSYSGTAHFDGNGTTYAVKLAYAYDRDGSPGTAEITGTFDGTRLSGKRLRTTGITGVLSGTRRKGVPASYTLSQDGLTLSGSYAGYSESFTRDPPPPLAKASIAADPLLTFVPGAPGTVFAPVQVQVDEGQVTLDVQPADALKLDAPQDPLQPGSYTFKAEAMKEGKAEVRLLAGNTVVAHAAIEVVKEQLYLVLFGYQGPEVTFESTDMETAKSHVLPKLQAAGFTVLEDGEKHDQSAIDGKLNDPKTPKKVIVDWCTCHDDWNKYFDRQTVRGYIWGSHGFMEPYPGCPDEELSHFESRQWSCTPSDPSAIETRHFIREWKVKLDKNAYTLDFGLNHACCTGGIGDYAKECWEYCNAETKSRAEKFFGGTLPGANDLTYTTHDSLKGHFKFQQNFNGSSYFGMWDVKWDDLEASIAP